ncbi:hypothetical protein EF294_03285 [Gordonia oryzae]|uniref:Uncharacterized protein n=1 Tax=Gordonia oryzae TaxID=2487349 RepID=A0A3N4GS33_9ACTN|nr:hypothetical protein [Gordonia oryzae]RPA65773.1 hypothetical protein EF294_03285 [Gordonia oryzae]
MSDPAVEAAWRAFGALWPDQGHFEFDFDSKDYALLTAREMAAPIRELHKPRGSGRFQECIECHTPWPCATARLVYTEEELS